MEFDELSHRVIGCALEVHRELGPGLLESTYERCLVYELGNQGIAFRSQYPLPVHYKDVVLDCGYRIDLMVEDKLLIELKSVDQIMRIHQAQILTCLRLTGISIGLLINFNMVRLKDGIKRYVL